MSDGAQDPTKDALEPPFSAAAPATLRHRRFRSGAVSEKLPSVVAQDLRRVMACQDPGLVVVFTDGSVKVPERRRRMVADYINRVNYGLKLGCLEMDPEDGEVRARSSGPIRADDPPQANLLGPLFV